MSASMPYDLTNESNLRQFSNYYAGNFMATNNISDDRGNGRKEQITEMQQIVETSMPESSKKEVFQILDKIEALKPAEKLMLYLRLPTGLPETDPLKQPQNPLGTRLEINHTINWVRSHLEIDPNVSIPKQDVYDDYVEYCNKVNIKPLSTADFGKVMKQVFPSIRPRRLGTRGNSRYCYAALRKTTQLTPPLLPDLKVEMEIGKDTEDDDNSNTIKAWASNLLSLKFERMEDLANYITTNNLNSISAKVLQRKLSRDARTSHKKLNETISAKKRRRKRRITSQSQSTEAVTSTSGNAEVVEKFAKKSSAIQPPLLLSNIKTEIDLDSKDIGTKTTLNETKVYCDKNFDTNATQYSSVNNNCQREPVKVVKTVSPNLEMKPPCPRNPIDNIENGSDMGQGNLSLKRSLNVSTNPSTKSKFIFREPNNVEQTTDNADDTTDMIIPRERVISISTLDKDALDSYLVEGENSQDQEAELLEYFQSDEGRVGPTSKKPTVPILENYQLYSNDIKANRKISFDDNTKQIFELRSYLQQNFDATKNLSKKKPLLPTNTQLNVSDSQSVTPQQRHFKSKRAIKPMTKSQNGTNLNVPQSPNARRQKYNFVPISPGPQSPMHTNSFNFNNNNTIVSSPFISPGVTPKPRKFQNHPFTPTHSVDQFELNGTFSKPFQLKEEISASAPASPQSLKANSFQFFPGKLHFSTNDRFAATYNTNATTLSLTENRSQSVPIDSLFPQKYNHYSSTCQTPIPPEYIDFGSHELYLSTIPNQLLENKHLKPLRINPTNLSDVINASDLTNDIAMNEMLTEFQFKHQLNPTSRSVPSTPHPLRQKYHYSDVEMSSFKPFDLSKSVPTTPITMCPFRYSPELNRDFLINGNTVDLDSMAPLYKDTSNIDLCDGGLPISDQIEELSSFDNVADPIIGSDLLSNI